MHQNIEIENNYKNENSIDLKSIIINEPFIYTLIKKYLK